MILQHLAQTVTHLTGIVLISLGGTYILSKFAALFGRTSDERQVAKQAWQLI